MDTIGDFLTIIRNASTAGNSSCVAQWSQMRSGIAAILKQDGYIHDFKVTEDEKGFKVLKIVLKYVDGKSVITSIKRSSRPGCRRYYPYLEIPRVLRGLGISILTTSKGLKNDKTARREKLGGEEICQVW